jgi:hypothetical protein
VNDVSKMNDLDLMLHADGEGDPAVPGPSTAGERAKIEGIREVGTLVRGHLELEADDAEDRLAGLWDLVERRLDAEERAAAPAVVRAPAPDPGLWARMTGWVGRYRSQLATGFVAAGAAAAIAVVARPSREVTKTVYVDRPVIGTTGTGTGDPALITAAYTPTEVESLDVTGGTGAVFTIDDDDGGETTVIWVTPEELEGL